MKLKALTLLLLVSMTSIANATFVNHGNGLVYDSYW